MKSFLKTMSVLLLIFVIVLSSLVIVAAEDYSSEGGAIITASDERLTESPRAYELIWKFKYNDVHLWKRRWNMTLGEWYDPDWILVY